MVFPTPSRALDALLQTYVPLQGQFYNIAVSYILIV